MSLDQSIAGRLAQTGETVETLQHRDQEVDVVEGEVLHQLAVH